MAVFKSNDVQLSYNLDFMKSFFENREPDCILYSLEGTKFDVHKEILYHSKWMRNIFIDAKDTCCREIEILCPCSINELETIKNFLYNGATSVDTETKVSETINNLTKIFGFPDNLFLVDDESVPNKPKLSKIKEEFDPDLNDLEENNAEYVEYQNFNEDNLYTNESFSSNIEGE